MNATSPAAALDDALLQRARRQAQQSGRPLLTELAELEALGAPDGREPRQLVRALAARFAMPVMETADMLALAPAFDLLPLPKALQRNCALLRNADGMLSGVVADPFDGDLQSWLDATAGQALTTCLALPADIQAYLARQEESARAVDGLGAMTHANQGGGRTAAVLSFASVSEAASPAVKLVDSTLYDALKAGASDIHLESTAQGLAVKYRIDGVLDAVTALDHRELAEQVVSRLKVLAELDIAERRVPQDGSFRVALGGPGGGREIDLRVSIMPSIHGEDAVIRILDKHAMVEAHGALTLEALGFDAAALKKLRALAGEPYGMLLVTGPTGSGKTTTLYAALSEIHSGRDKIVTIEDPVEYQLPGILQVPVNERKGLSFARGLRSILRHDPDKIMVGEIRDRETAEIAVQSALTGHLVLTTVHANNVFDVFGRFTHMGIDPYAFVSALNGIWAQRLVRINCPHCARPAAPSVQELEAAGLNHSDLAGFRFMRGAGCGDCRGTGYKGRRAIAEILLLDDELRELIVDKRPIRQIKEAARAGGTRSLREAALDLVRQGATTLDEIKRVTLHA